MQFEDETRSQPISALAKRSEYLADIDRFIVEHEEFIERHRRDASSIGSLERELKSAELDKLKLQREARSLQEDNKNLRASLTALRHSKRLKIGSAVVSPAGAIVRLLPRPALKGSALQRLKSMSGHSPSTETGSETYSAGQAGTVGPVERADELRKKVLQDPSKANVYGLIAHLYFVLGSVAEPANLIETYAGVLTELTPKEQQLIDAVLGLDRLTKRRPQLPVKQDTPGYQVERGRILYCAHSVSPYNSNGYSTRTAGLVKGLTQLDADVVIAARPGYPWDIKTDIAPKSTSSYTQVIDGIEHYFSQGPTWTQSPLDYYIQQAADSYVQVATRNRVERIHAASNHVTALPALIAARRLGLPFSYEVRGLWEITESSTKAGWESSDRFRISRDLETLVAVEADAVFAITDQVRDELVHRGVPSEKISILPNAVDTDEFSVMPPHEPTRQRLGINGDVPVIGYAGSLLEYEGLGTLLEACQQMMIQGIDFRLVVVGDGAALPSLKSKAAGLGISDVSVFTGRIPASEVAAFISVFDIMPCPRLSLPITEMVSPIKPLEAMAAAKAVVLSDLAPLRDLAGQDGERASLFAAGDVSQLAAVLGNLVASKDLRRDMGRRARLWTVAERTWRRVGEDVQTAFAASDRLASVADGVPLSELTIGIIADEFTTAGLRPDIPVVELLPDSWATQLASTRLDALFVESAWDGNKGAWRGKVGYYDEESFADLRALLEHCRNNSIPTIFWNKEDPIHFNRFQETAKHFQHVFTSDDGSIRRYLESAGEHVQTVASLPFYAQPTLHNPLPSSRDYSHTVTYAGSYYGARYQKRSDQLHNLLAAALPVGLTIYDRQHLNEDSPYKFPPDLAPYVSGGLAYPDMVEAYKAHPVHVNVNSVEQSGTMFSRRVFEVAACGGALVSGPGQGVDRVFGGIVPIVSERPDAQALIGYWMENEAARNADAWLSVRHVYRGHTASQRLTYVLRTAGVPVRATLLEKYAVRLDDATPEAFKLLDNQSVRPSLVILSQGPDQDKCIDLTSSIPIVDGPIDCASLRARGITLLGDFPRHPIDRTYYEDLLTSRAYLPWQSARIDSSRTGEVGLGLAYPETAETSSDPDLVALSPDQGGPRLVLNRAVSKQRQTTLPPAPVRRERILVAGHDLKFAGGLISYLESQGHVVETDLWTGHAQHDEAQSVAKLANADVVFCEWTLGNAVWYARNKRPGQRLVCRLHLQELDTPYLGRLEIGKVDQFIFVGRHIADVAQRDFKLPVSKSVVIPNYVDFQHLRQDKLPNAQWNIGLVGIVPQRKRLDLALDVLRRLRAEDERYHLYIKGKRPEDFHWMAGRTEELAFYTREYQRIEQDPLLAGGVTFDSQGDDMAEWYRKIGVALSVSDFESFHLTIADGAASGAVPASLAWAGSDQIYPSGWIAADLDSLIERIRSANRTPVNRRLAAEDAISFSSTHFAQDRVLRDLHAVIIGRQ